MTCVRSLLPDAYYLRMVFPKEYFCNPWCVASHYDILCSMFLLCFLEALYSLIGAKIKNTCRWEFLFRNQEVLVGLFLLCNHTRKVAFCLSSLCPPGCSVKLFFSIQSNETRQCYLPLKNWMKNTNREWLLTSRPLCDKCHKVSQNFFPYS